MSLRDAIRSAMESGGSNDAEEVSAATDDVGADAGPTVASDAEGAGQGDSGADPSEQPGSEDARTAGQPERARDESGRFAAKGKAKEADPVRQALKRAAAPQKVEAAKEGGELEQGSGKEQPAKDTLGQAPGRTPAPAATEVKAPASWNPLARERWAALPPEVREEVDRREREIATSLEKSAPARKLAEAFQATVAPYEALIRAEGADPIKAVGSLLQTAAHLRVAPVPQKAAAIAGLIQQYGIPLEALAAAIDGAGQGAPAGQQPGAPAQQQPYMDPRVDQLLAQMQAQQAQALQRQAADFAASHEFYEDVRSDMADLIEMAHRRGSTLTLEDAYARAVSLHPKIQAALAQRTAAEAAKASAATAQRARAASSSVRSQPAAPPSGAQPQNVRGALEAAIRGSSGR